ncbi:hypothetical protein Hc94105_1648 [Helicobacter cinaedi]|uniref:hypothetical protein n=1 Tax=Helicobacter cinaedi TaxID=213 RepID=UPI001F254943|nr:hypothetical protein [Helicobacter cinaedi]BDB67425.1 hypothetical protein Hc94105_1648 [Helicobacter cinaedi]
MQEKNYWPLGIIGVLLFGVFMVSVSITIALKNPIQDESTYFDTKRNVDERINEIITHQNLFNSLFSYTISLNADTTHEMKFVFPYYTPSHRPDIKKGEIVKIPADNVRLTFKLDKPTTQLKNITLFLDSPIQAGKLVNLGEFSTNDSHTFTSQTLDNLPNGRWKFILELSFITDSRDMTPKKAYLESEVFIGEIHAKDSTPKV